MAALLAEEHVELVPDEDRDKLREVDSLTGQPRADDILLFALPVRGPSPVLFTRLFSQDGSWSSVGADSPTSACGALSCAPACQRRVE